MKLEEIGFYTLSDLRAFSADETTPLTRCELILTSRCNFSCPYCRHVGGSDLPLESALRTLKYWKDEGLENIRFSGGEPTLYKDLELLVKKARSFCNRVAISTNGSADFDLYKKLLKAGVNDFSISLDACCSAENDKMTGINGVFDKVSDNIKMLSELTYVTVGVVLTQENLDTLEDIIQYADWLGVSDIRIIPAAQEGSRLREVVVSSELLKKYPILAYRIKNIQAGKSVRGLSENDTGHCGLVLDDMAVMGNKHYPCIIYMRESGKEIGQVGPNMRQERLEWYKNHDCHCDQICKRNCLDVCVDYNNTHAGWRK